MRTLDRNKRKFYYCLHTAKEKIYDADHNFTGDYTPSYAEAVVVYGNVSAASGSTDTEQFGTDISYDKTVCLQGTDWPIDENTVLILDNEVLNVDEFTGTGTDHTFTLNDAPLRIVEVMIDGTGTDAYTVVADEISFTDAPAKDAEIMVKYEPSIPNYDYIVVRVAVSLNHTVLAIKRVEK